VGEEYPTPVYLESSKETKNGLEAAFLEKLSQISNCNPTYNRHCFVDILMLTIG